MKDRTAGYLLPGERPAPSVVLEAAVLGGIRTLGGAGELRLAVQAERDCRVAGFRSSCRVKGLPKWQTWDMSIEQWWPKLAPATRDWLIENNGGAVPAEMVVEITQAGGVVDSEAWWSGEYRARDFYFSDEGVDWIEAVGNGEVPEPR